MFKKKSRVVLAAIFCIVVACTSFFACSKSDGNATSGTEMDASNNTSKKKIKKAKLPTKPSAEEDFVVTLTSDGTGAKVTGYVGKGGGVYIPATIQGLPVKSVDMEIPRTAGVTALVVSDGCEYVRVFSDKDEFGKRTVLAITNVSLPDRVETYNLRNTMITEFEVPANAEKVYRLPITLEKVSFRGATKEISEGAFEGTQITSIVLPEGMEKIRENAFKDCSKLKTVTLPNSLWLMSGRIFADCVSLESINLPESLSKYGDPSLSYETFKNCSSLKEITIPESLTSMRISADVFTGCSNVPLATQARLRELGYRGEF